MISYENLPILLWGYAFLTGAYLLNKAPTKSIEITPMRYRLGDHRVLSMLRFKVSIFVKKLKIEKLEPKFEKGRFMGYPKDSL